MGHKRQQFAACRKQRGYTQESLAAALGVDRTTVRRWEAGNTDPIPIMWTRLGDVLNVSSEVLQDLLFPGPAGQPSRSGTCAPTAALGERRALLAAAVGAITALITPNLPWLNRITVPKPNATVRIGAADIGRIRTLVELFRSLDYQYGGGLVYTSVANMAEQIHAITTHPCDDRVRRDLLVAVGELRVLTGWVAFDICNHAEALRHFHAAERLAVAAEEPSLAAFARYCQARQLQHQRHNRDAIDVMHLATDHLGATATPAATAMIHATTAPSLAALGDRRGALTALNAAQRAFESIDVVVEPTWVGWLNEPELMAQYGRVYRDLARADRAYAQDAVDWTQSAIRGFGADMARSSALNLIGECSALFLAGEVDTAVSIGQRLPDEATTLTSQRIRDRITRLSRDTVGYQHRNDVAELTHALTTLPSRLHE